MEAAILLVGLAILGLAGVGFISIVMWLGRLGQPKLPPAPVAVQPPPWRLLTRAQKLAVVDDVLGERMPSELAAELQSLMPWHQRQQAAVLPVPVAPMAAMPAPVENAGVATPAPVDNAGVALVASMGGAEEATPTQITSFDFGAFAAPAGPSAGAATVDDSPLRPSPEVALAAMTSKSRLRRFLSFENVIFLLAACLILGGTLYLVATTWSSISSRWQHLYAELLVVAYGWMLLGAGRWLRRRLGLDPPAVVLATIAVLMSVAAGELSAAAFSQGFATGLAGSALAQLLAIPAAGALLRLHHANRKMGLLYGASVLALSLSGLCLAQRAPAAGTWVAAFGVFAGAAGFARTTADPRPSLLISVLGTVAGVCLLPATLSAPAGMVAPSLAALGFACRPARRLLAAPFAVAALPVLLGGAFVFGFESLPMAAGIALVGLLATVDLAVDSPSAILFGLGAALVLFLAFAWTSVFGLEIWPTPLTSWNGSPAQLARASAAALGALPWVLAAFATALVMAEARARTAVEGVGYLILALAAAVASLPLPRVGVASSVALVALASVAYANAAHREGRTVDRNGRFLVAHLVGMLAVFAIGRLGGQQVAAVAVAAYAVVLLALRRQVGWWLGLTVVPIFAVTAILLSHSRWAPCGILAAYALALLLPRPVPKLVGQVVILPALVASLLIGLFYSGAGEAALLGRQHLSLLLVLAVTPPLLWIASGRAPLFILVEVAAALVGALPESTAAPTLLATLVLLAGRDPRALRAAALAFIPLAILAVEQDAGRFIPSAALVAGAALCLLRPLPVQAAFVRWLGMPAALVAAMTLFLLPPTVLPWPSPQTTIPLAAAAVLPFFLVVLIRRAPAHLVVESAIVVALLLAGGIVAASSAGAGLTSALISAAAALSLLAVHRRHADLPGLPGDTARLLRRLVVAGFVGAIATAAYVTPPIPGWLARGGVGPAMAAAVLPFFAVMAWRHEPDFLAIDSVVLTIAVAIVSLGYAIAGWPAHPSALASAVCALVLLIPVHEKSHQARRLSFPLFLAAWSALYLRGLPGPVWFYVLALTAATVPFFVAVWLRGGPQFLSRQVLVASVLFASAGLGQGLNVPPGSDAARSAGVAALAALGMLLVLSGKSSPVLERAAWIAVPLLCPIAVIPLFRATLAWPAAITSLAAVAVLCRQSKRRHDSLMGAIAVGVGLVALAWAGVAAAKPFSHGGDPARHLGLVAIVIAGYGMAMGSQGARVSAATPAFLRRFGIGAVVLGEAALFLGIGLRSAPTPMEAVLVVVAFGALSCAAVDLAFRLGQGWPFYLAESALGLSYGYLRVRTHWLDGMADLDSLLACILAFINLGIARTLERWRAGLGAKESRILGNLLPLLAPLFLQIDSPVRAMGTFAAAAAYAWFARQQKRPIFGWAAGILANVGLIPLWLHYDVHSPVAFALPAGLTLGLLGRVYQNRLGKHGPMVRSLASLFVFGATSYQMFQFSSVWPALILALSSVAAVLLGIVWRVRAYLYLGFASLVLDIVSNLTRWGMEDRLRGALFGLGAGMALLALGVLVAHHKKQLLERFRSVQGWTW